MDNQWDDALESLRMREAQLLAENTLLRERIAAAKERINRLEEDLRQELS